MRRAFILTIEVVALIVSVLVVLFGLLLWRLSSAPVSLETIQPWLTNALVKDLDGVTVRIGKAEAVWGGLTDLLQVRMQDVDLSNEVSAQALLIPDMTAVFSLSSFLSGEYVPVELRLRRPHLLMAAALNDADQSASQTGTHINTIDHVKQVLGFLAAPADGDSAFSGLDEITIENGRVTLDNAMWKTPLRVLIPKLHSKRDIAGLRVDGSMRIALGIPPAMMSINALYRSDSGLLASHVDFAGVAADQLQQYFPEIRRIGRFNDPVSGFANVTLDPRSLDVKRAKFALQSGRGLLALSDLLDQPIAFDQLVADFAYDGDRKALTIAELSLDRGDHRLALSGQINGPLAQQKWSVTGTMQGLAVDDLDQIWPANLLTLSRRWVVQNLSGGAVDTAAFSLQGDLANWLPDQLTVTAYTADIGFSDVQVEVLPRLPPLQKTNGKIHFENDQMVISVASAQLQKSRITKGNFTVTGLASDSPQAVADFAISGQVRDGFKLVTQAVPQTSGNEALLAQQLGGAFAGQMKLTFPLRHSIPIEAVDLRFEGDITGGQLKQIVGDYNLTKADMKLSVDGAVMQLEGRAEVAGIDLQLTHRHWFGSASKQLSETRAIADLTMNDQRQFGFDFGDHVRGPIAVEAAYLRQKKQPAVLKATFDFVETALELPPLEWQKPAQAVGVLHLQAGFPRTGVIEISSFDFVGGALSVDGSASLHKGALHDLKIRRLATRDTDISLSVTARKQRDEKSAGYDVTVKGRRFNAQPLLMGWQGSSGFSVPNIDLVANLDQIDVGLANPLLGATVSLGIDEQQFQQARVSTRLGAGELRVVADADGGVTIDASRADAFFDWLGFGRPISGGKLTVKGHLLTDGRFTGLARIGEFNVVDAPVLAQIFRLASFTGVLDALRGRSLTFKTFNAAITLDKQAFQVTEGFAYGPSLGISVQGRYKLDDETVDFSGMVAPASALNLVINRFPILGRMITGGRKEGLLAAQYKAVGAAEQPTVVVNPLTAILPGFLRGLVRLGESEIDRSKAGQN